MQPFVAKSFDLKEENIFILPTGSAKPVKVYFEGNTEIKKYGNEEYKMKITDVSLTRKEV